MKGSNENSKIKQKIKRCNTRTRKQVVVKEKWKKRG